MFKNIKSGKTNIRIEATLAQIRDTEYCLFRAHEKFTTHFAM